MKELALGDLVVTKFCNLVLSVNNIDDNDITCDAFFGKTFIRVVVDIEDILVYASDEVSLKYKIERTIRTL